MFKSTLAKKIIMLGFSTVIALIALWQIEGLIHDRLEYQEEARRSIANSWSGEQQIIGPILVIPYTYLVMEEHRDTTDNKYYSQEVERAGLFYVIPEKMQLDSDLTTQERSRGIFSFPVYTTEIKVMGEFDLSAIKDLENYENVVKIGTPYLSVSLSDARGINNKPILVWQESKHDFEVGSQLSLSVGSQTSFSEEGIHVSLPNLSREKVDFSFNLNLRGMGTLWFTPIAKDTNVNLNAAWGHPNFVGKFLPAERTIESDNFQANWKISEFSSSITKTGYKNLNNHMLWDNRFGVLLETPVDIYRLSIRSTKYGLLFVGLTFISFFVFEILKRLQIHPVQYTLVALSLSVFYLLLIALSEAFGFVLAYLMATTACVSLLTFYIYSILRNLKWGLIFGGFIASLYFLLYVILNSEDHALLLGSSLVFIMLGLVMIITRNLNWHKVGGKAND